MKKHNIVALKKIIADEAIKPVYQPILSLANGEIFGYEALSRITKDSLQMRIETLFNTSDLMGKSWELEALCHKCSLAGASALDKKRKLFINVNPNIIHDEKFKEGFLEKRLAKYNLNPSNIIFEITERCAVNDEQKFIQAINYYKEQHYSVAIDDVGAGFSGLNLIAATNPDFIKIDMKLIRNIDGDKLKTMLVKNLTDFCHNVGIKSIAEGIESESELKTLIDLGVNYGQGFYLGRPHKELIELPDTTRELIGQLFKKQYKATNRGLGYPEIFSIAKKGYVFNYNENSENVFEMVKQNQDIQCFCVLDKNKIKGFMTRADLLEKFGGRYGHSLNYKKTIEQVALKKFLRVEHNMTIDHVAHLAMQRSTERLYDPIVVEYNEQYSGIATIKDLLARITRIETTQALHRNPLTGLPGNITIEHEITSRILGNSPYCIIYIDVDNFKAYNDAYGFENGDIMLKIVANLLLECAQRDEFVGHIGGDDFIIISDHHEGEKLAQTMIELFDKKVRTLYREEDVKRGYIISRNRHGVAENFPLASLSIAGISNQHHQYTNLADFSNEIAKLKKKCKQHEGNYYNIK